MKWIITYLFSVFCLVLAAQEERPVVTKNFHFNDGIYLSFSEFQSNAPSFSMEEVSIKSFTNPQTFLTQVEHLADRKTNKAINIDQVWGLTIDGIPFIKLPSEEISKELPTFAALKLRGKICYFTYPDYRVKRVPVAAYNPVTGRPFLKGEVERDEEVIVEKILNFETGQVVGFNLENLLEWIQEDRHLTETIERLPPEEAEEKLFRLLLIYVDRHETRIK